jgi:hypothetical protein
MATLRFMTQNRAANASLPVSTYIGAGPYDVVLTLNTMLDSVRKENPILGALISPGFLKLLGANDRANVRKLLLSSVLGSQSDISFDPTFLDNFLNDDDASIRIQSNVNDWTPITDSVFSRAGRYDGALCQYGVRISGDDKTGRNISVGTYGLPGKTVGAYCLRPSFLINGTTRLGGMARGL